MTGSIYAKRLLLMLGLAFAWVVLLPLLVTLVSGCGKVGGACGAVALLSGFTLLPLGFLVIFSLMARIVGQRLAALGVSGWWALLLLPLLLLGDAGALLSLGGHWSVGFSLGTLGLALPWRLFAAIATLIFLGCYPDGARLSGWTTTKAIALGLLAFLSLSIVTSLGLSMLALWNLALRQEIYQGAMNRILVTCLQAHPLAFGALLVCYGRLVWQARRANDGENGAHPGLLQQR